MCRTKNNVKKNIDIFWHKGKVTYEDRCKNLDQIGLVVWFTGLSGAGKSTIAAEVEKELIRLNKAVYVLDGDNIRHGLCSDLGFSKKDRNENVRRIAETAALFKDAGLIVLVACISPIGKMRDFARQRIGADNFREVYVKADIKVCIERDPKGLYKKVKGGQIKDFTGITSEYETPEKPDLIIDTTITTIKESTLMVIDMIMKEVDLVCR
ncbi:adenylyl-sulfate kinase [Paramaledivibacter caminithermalis]|jgi:adenylylsulfate kinase|uniref:Adenylyl-sulfate kinase n=1 Tax=Paramaledivibacter caminithermalis (strain DSM 15212 / CIP 107654 / DViRD3) TaxID=1121301 RepID=A0A1M6JU83_PARC5|nr:adenylyl-sulfate kinase [Paramaledivibacter caminithermalis]SHJ50253.1 adenylylsulfate kinase [Paramaledivibacter caminithermalis DSM 15212]